MPLVLILLPYGILLAIFAIFSAINLFHIIRFGSLTFASFFATFLFLAATVLILFATYSLLLDTDWFAPLLELIPNPPSLEI